MCLYSLGTYNAVIGFFLVTFLIVRCEVIAPAIFYEVLGCLNIVRKISHLAVDSVAIASNLAESYNERINHENPQNIRATQPDYENPQDIRATQPGHRKTEHETAQDPYRTYA
jgi:hypothetical protein